MSSNRLITILNEKAEIRRALDSMKKDIHVHKLALEKTIMKIHTHLDALGFERPTALPAAWIHKAMSSQSIVVGLDALAPVLDTCNRMQKSEDRRRPISRRLHLEDRKNKSIDISRWVEALAAPNMIADPRIAHPDPDADSEAETTWNPRVCYTDLPGLCSRQEWLSWVSKAWGNYSSLKAQGKKLKQTLTNTIAAYNSLVYKDVWNDTAFTPSTMQILDDMGKEMSVCRKLRSRVHELLPAFEWCD